MAWNYFLNMEPIAIEAAEEAILRMTSNNYWDVDDIGYLDESVFCQNVKHGFIALTMMTCYLESCVNSILKKMGYSPSGELMRASIRVKLEVIYAGKDNALKRLYRSTPWKDYQIAVMSRNSLVHYKDAAASCMSSAPLGESWTIAKNKAGDFFTKETILHYHNATKQVVATIADDIGLEISAQISPITSDAIDSPASYLQFK